MKNNISRLLFQFFLLLCFIVLPTCTKLEKEMLVSTGELTNVLTNTAEASGLVIDLGNGANQHGHCFATTPNVTIDDLKTQLGVPTVTGGFTSQLTNLEAGTKYYIKAYISKGTETVYGEEINFTTVSASLPTLITTAITSVTTSSASTGGNVTSNGGASITARGLCWNTSPNPTIANEKSIDGTGTFSFARDLSGLLDNTTYYVKAYATNSAGTAYGNELSFTTFSSTPILTTTQITSVTTNTATSGGNITSDGGASVAMRGVCWGTAHNPTTAASNTNDGSGTGTFVSNLTGLTANTTYYIRAYAFNGVTIAYGNEVTFTTGAALSVVPTLTTTSITSFTTTTATSGGTITSDGGASITTRGVCWGTAHNPTTAISNTNDGTGTGSFVSNIAGLADNTTYYVRAYAFNGVGIGYGNEVTFTTVAAVVPTLTTTVVTSIAAATASSGGTISSDGGAVIIASGVCWSITASPTIIGSKTTDVASASSFTSSITGLAVNTLYYVRAYATNSAGTAYGNQVSFTTENPSTHLYSLIGTGFYKPDGITQSDWGYDFDFTVIGWTTQVYRYRINQVKMIGNDIFKMRRGHDWAISYGYPEIIITGDPTNFVNSSTNIKVLTSKTYEITFLYDIVNNTLTLDFVILSPTITTNIVTGITSTTAVSGGNVTSEGTTFVTARGICWSTSPNPTISGSYTTNGAGIGGFVSNLSGLTGATTYYVRSYATNSSGTSYGNQVSFTTSSGL